MTTRRPLAWVAGKPAELPSGDVLTSDSTGFTAIQTSLTTLTAAAVSAGAVVYSTLAGLNADLAHAAGVLGFVYADSTAANNGIYAKTGSSGSGSWVFTGVTLASLVTFSMLGSDVLAYFNGEALTQGVYPATAGTNTIGVSTSTVIPNTAISTSGFIGNVSIYSALAGPATLVIVSIAAGVATLQYSQAVTLAAGANTIANFNPYVQAGWFIGVYSAGQLAEYSTPSGSWYYCSGIPGASTPLSSSGSSQLRIGWTVTTGILGETIRAEGAEALEIARAGAAEAGLQTQITNLASQTVQQGVYPAVAGSFPIGVTSSTAFSAVAIAQQGVLGTVSIYSALAGPATLVVASISGGNATLQASQAVTLAVGLNTFSNFNPGVQAGWFVGLYSVGQCVEYTTSTPGVSWEYCAGLPGVSTPVSTVGNSTLSLGWSVKAGLSAEILRAGAAEAGLQTQITNLASQAVQQGINPPVSATAGATAGNTWFASAAVSQTGPLTSVSLYARSAATVTLVAASVSGGVATLQASQTVTLAVGVNTITAWNPLVQAGWYIGVYSPTVSAPDYLSSSGAALPYTVGLCSASGSALSTSAGNLLEFGYSVLVGLAGEVFRAEAAEAVIQAGITGGSVVQGQTATSSTGSIAAGYTTFGAIPVSATGRLSQVQAYVGAGGPAVIVVATLTGSNIILTAQQAVTVTAGLNTIAVALEVTAGQYVGIYAAAQVGASYGPSSGSNANYCAGLPTSSTAMSHLANYASAIAWTTLSGVLPRLVALETGPSASFASSGIGLLSSADATGVADATAIFAAAKSAHPAPLVPAGTFAVTAIPNELDGFWGEGKIKVNGVYYPIPRKPMDGSLLLKTRSALSGLAASGSPKVLIGDSLSAGPFYPGVYANHWFNKLTAWLNNDYAPGSNPAEALLQDDSPSNAAFFGLTVAGTVTFGTAGPLHRSTILAAGASLTFNGPFYQVDAFYTQQSGAGSLVFAYNGTTYKTVACAGSTVLDAFTGPSLTGQTGVGPYTITASGGPVELTGLVRLGTPSAVAGTPKPILTMRQAHGGYTTADYATAQVASIVKQAQGIGGAGSGATPEYTVSLMTNDALFGAAPRPASYQSNLTALLTGLQASGASRVEMVAPPRPYYPGWGSYYSTGQNWDNFVGIAIAVCKSLGVPLLRLDEIDFYGEGLFYSDNLHWTAAANQVVFDTYARWRPDN
jgi:hypothetical protein